MGNWRGRAFGIELESACPIPGLHPISDRARTSVTRFELTSAEDLDAAWPAELATGLVREPAGSQPAQTIDRHDRVGYRLYARGYGVAVVDPAGRLVRCALSDTRPSGGQRFLLGRVLPWAALLNGLEVFHASAVALERRAVAFFGPSGAGKSAAALRLVLAEGRLFTDDVLALERSDEGTVVAHPGPPSVALREPEWRLFEREGGATSGGTLLERGDKFYVGLPGTRESLPLAAVYLLTRSEAAADEKPAIKRCASLDPRILIGSTFIRGVDTEARLRNQLEVCAELVRSVPCYRVAAVDAHALAEHARRTCRAFTTTSAQAP